MLDSLTKYTAAVDKKEAKKKLASMKDMKTKDITIIGGGTGVAPPRSVLDFIERNRDDYGDIRIFLGYFVKGSFPKVKSKGQDIGLAAECYSFSFISFAGIFKSETYAPFYTFSGVN